MYQKGDYINYSGHGICQVKDIRSMDFRTGAGARNYYILSPVNQEGTVFYLPEEGADARSRRLLTREEIEGILSGICDAQMPWIPDRKQRTEEFHKILSRRDTGELLLLAACLHRQQLEKALSTADRETLRRVEGMIEQEFSLVLGLQASEIGGYILGRLEEGSIS